MGKLEEFGLLGNTLILFLADNGTQHRTRSKMKDGISFLPGLSGEPGDMALPRPWLYCLSCFFCFFFLCIPFRRLYCHAEKYRTTLWATYSARWSAGSSNSCFSARCLPRFVGFREV